MARVTYPCSKCEGPGWIRGGKWLKDGTYRRQIKCQKCGDSWVTTFDPSEPQEGSVQFWGLWRLSRTVWLSPEDQERIRESARMGGLLDD